MTMGCDSQDCKAIERFVGEIKNAKTLNPSVFETSESEGVTIRLRLPDGKVTNHSVHDGLTGTGNLSEKVKTDITEFIEANLAKS